MYPFGTPCPGKSSSRRGHIILVDVINGNVSSHGSLYDAIWQRIFDVASFLRVEWKRAYDVQPDAFVRIQDRHREIGTTARTNRAAGANVPSFVLHSI
jgi:GH35 family endo-1,4-beta-xylanase